MKDVSNCYSKSSNVAKVNCEKNSGHQKLNSSGPKHILLFGITVNSVKISSKYKTADQSCAYPGPIFNLNAVEAW